MNQQHDPRPQLPSSTARYGGLDHGEAPDDGPELFPGEKALSRTKAGSREEMRVLRRHYNWVNMVAALVGCLALVLVALALAPRPQGDITRDVEYAAVAETVQPDVPFTLAVPAEQDGWHANAAALRHEGTPAAETWYVSLVADDDSGWMQLRQVEAEETPESWTESHLEGFALTGDSELEGVRFDRHSATDGKDIALVGEVDGTRLLLAGSGQWEALEQLARDAVTSLQASADGGSEG